MERTATKQLEKFVRDGLEKWVYAISALFTKSACSGTELFIGWWAFQCRADTQVSMRERIGWLQLISGAGRLGGEEGWEIPPARDTTSGPFIPITRHDWVAFQEDSRVEIYDTISILGSDPDLAVLDDFNRWVLERGERHLERAEARRRTSVASRVLNDQEVLGDSLELLAATLASDSAESSFRPERSRDSVLSLFERVFGHYGLDMINLEKEQIEAFDSDIDLAEHLLAASQVAYREVHLKGQWWTEDNGSLIAFDKSGHGVALLREGKVYKLHRVFSSNG